MTTDTSAATHAHGYGLATVASDAVFTPMDTVKQRLQLTSSPYTGVSHCVRTVFRDEGLRAFFVSYRTTVLMNAPYTAVHFSTYEAAKRVLGDMAADEDSLAVHATAGAAAGALAAALTTPLDVVKTQLQCQVRILCNWLVHRSKTQSLMTYIADLSRILYN
jgi:solute carrier family 25 iron transporter 28/37